MFSFKSGYMVKYTIHELEIVLLHLFLSFAVVEVDCRVEYNRTVFKRSGEVVLDLTTSQSPWDWDVRWKYKQTLITRKTLNLSNYSQKYGLLKNGSLTIHKGDKTDNGTYTVEIFANNGTCILKSHFELVVLDPVSKPKLEELCDIHGRTVLFCSVERGDSVQIKWIQGKGSTTKKLFTSPGFCRQHVFYPDMPMNESVTCVAKNEISKEISSPALLICRGHTASLAALGVFIFLTTLFFVFLKSKQVQLLGRMHNDIADKCYVEMHPGVPQQKDDLAKDNLYEFCAPGVTAKRENTLEREDIYV